MTSDDTLDRRYFDWLYSQIGPAKNNRNPARSFWLLAEQLFKKQFNWHTPNDDNRIEDGKDLRDLFLEDIHAERNQSWLDQECSMLEIMVALSRSIEFESSHDAYYWFWRMIENLNLRIYTDDKYDDDVHFIVDDALNIVIDRTYLYDGTGGLFPLRHSKEDQRNVEIWYQMSAYLLEDSYE